MSSDNAVQILVYRWAGAWGPFKVSIPCGECALTHDVIDDTVNNELDWNSCSGFYTRLA